MPNFKYIEAGTPPPDVPPEATVDELVAAIAKQEELCDKFRAARYEVRQTVRRSDVLAELANTEGPFNEALKELADLQKRLARKQAAGPGGTGQVVSVGTATETASAGGTNG